MKLTRRFCPQFRRAQRADRPAVPPPSLAPYRVLLTFACTCALAGWALGPAVSRCTPGPVTNSAAVTTITLEFTQVLDPARAGSASAYEVLSLGANRAVGGGDDTLVSVAPAYTAGALLVTLTTPVPLAEGRYRITATSDATNGLRNLAAEVLDQNQDGTPDSYVGYLDVDLTAPTVSAVVAGTCLRFDDGGDLVSLPAAALHGRAAYTIELWFQTAKTGGQALLGAMQSNGTMAMQFWLSGGTLWLETAAGSPSVALPDVYDGRWHHLAASYSDAADRLEVVYDGTVVASFPYTGAPPSVADGAFVVGQEQDAPGGGYDAGQAFQGRLAEVRIWEVARTAAEVASAMFRQAVGDEAGLVACWHLDDASDSIPDAAGNGFAAALGDWQGGDAPRWAPASGLLLESRTLHVTYADVVGMDAVAVAERANYAVLRSGGDGDFEDGNETDLTAGLQTVAYLPATTAAVLRFGAPFTEDLYRLTIAAGVRDTAGNALQGGTDYTSPGVPVAVGLPGVVATVAPADDTGASDTDALTRRTRPEFRVAVDRRGTVAADFDCDGTFESSVDAPAAGVHGVAPATDLPEGATTVVVRFASWLGAERRLRVPLVVDTVPPRVSGVAVGTALNFDGTDDYVATLPRTWGFTTSATLAAWVKTTDSTGTVISLAHGDVNNELLLLISDGKAQIVQHKQPGHYWYRNGTSIVNHGRWVHLAGVVDGTGTGGLRIFVNGIEEALGVCGQAGSPTAVSDATPRQVALGGRLRSGYRSELLAGQIDEVQVWGRTLTPAEVAAMVGASPTGTEPGLAGCWRLDEGVGTSAADVVSGVAASLGDGATACRPTWTHSAAPFSRRSVRITYDDLNAMDEESVLDVSNYTLTASGGDGVFGDGDDSDLSASLADLSYDPVTRTATLRCDPPLAGEVYQLTIAGTTRVRDGAGNPLLGGSDFHSDPLPTPARPPAVAILLDPASDTGSSSHDLLTGDATPVLSVTVSDRGTLAVYVDGELVPGWGQAVVGAGTYALTAPSPLASGYHHVVVVFSPWVGDGVSTQFDLVVETGGPRVTAVDPYTPSPCTARTLHFDRPVRVADFLPEHVALADALGTPIGTASAVTPLFPGLLRNPATGTWYLPVYRPEGYTWFEAETEARRLGGSLVAIADGAEMAFVRNLVADLHYWRHVPGDVSSGPWIGLRRDPETPGPYYHWFWPDGAPLGYTYWGSGQPYDAGGGQCVVRLGGDYRYWYDDVPASVAPGFVAEFPAVPLYASSWRVDFGALPGGAEYTLAFGPNLADAAGNPLDQDGDGTPGETDDDRFTGTFAVAAPAPGLQVVSASPTGGDPAAAFRHIEVTFNRPVDAGSVGIGDAMLTPAAGGAVVAPSALSQVDDLRWRFDFGVGATGQAYDLAVGPQITAAAIAMDQDGDGVPGEAADDVYRARLQTANLTLNDGDTALDAAHLVLWGGTHTFDGSHTLASIALLNGAVLTHSACSAAAVHRLDLTVHGTVFVDPTSAIDVTGKGYLAGRTAGNLLQDPTQHAGGGSHGGLGRAGTTVGAVPAAYDDFADPHEPGGGGSVAGGGLVRLQAGTLVLEGTIRADGASAANSSAAGGGAGGGVRLDVGTLAGAGLVTADGGAGDGGYYGYYGGAGGGGRVAVYYGTLAGFEPASQVRALSRNYPIGPGSVGTVYLSPLDGPDQLRLDSQGTTVGQYTPLLSTAQGGVAVAALVVSGAGVVAQTDPGVGIAADEVSILGGATLTHTPCTAAVTCSLDVTVTGSLFVDAASVIDVTGRGYLPGRTDGNTPPDPAQGPAGGSHGGLGRTGTSGGNTPAAYGEFAAPDQPGGGGSQTAGGGLVWITAGTAIVDGSIKADGGDVTGSSANSAGAGGGIWIQTDTLAGTGLISADGGAGGGGYYGYYGGSGGGGRVALYYHAADDFDLETRVTAHSRTGGSGPGSLGTVYLCPAGQTPRLRVDSHGTAVGVWTPLLPGAAGVVSVGDLTVAGAGVVVAPFEGAPIRAESIAVLRGANLTHPVPSAAATFSLTAQVAGTLFVDAESRIDASSRGCPGTTTLGVRTVGAAKSGAGGSHGGAGYGNSSNSLYGQPENPRYPGSGGAPRASNGGSGGGLVRLHAGVAVIDGAVLANGGHGSYYWAMTGGSGGGVLINVGDWSGTGVVEAKGGNGNWGDYGGNGGSGGGGRIAVHVGGNQGVDVPSLSAAGGTGGSGRGGDGTVVLNTAPSFFWADPRPGVFGDAALLGWELLAAPADTTVTLYAAAAGAAEVLLAGGLPAVGSHTWNTTALPSGVYRVRAVYGDGAHAVTGEASRDVLIRHGAALHGGMLTADETWSAGVLHLVADDITIPADVTLTLAAGALVKVAAGRTLRVLPGGAVVSAGTAETPAVVTSLRDDACGGDDNGDGGTTSPAPGDWGGVVVDAGTALPGAASLRLLYGTREQAGEAAASTTWEAENLHRVRDDVTVSAGKSLTIAAGAMVRFDRTRAIVVSGTLQAAGAVGAPILMTSLYDADSDAPGVLGGPYAGHVPAVGDWLGVYVEAGGSGVFDRVHLRYGGGRQTGYDRTAMLRSRRAAVTVRNCRIEDAQYDGVTADGPDASSRFEMANCIVSGCDVGFYGGDNSYGVCQVLGTTFYGNRLGVRLDWGAGTPRIIRNSIIAQSTEIGISVSGGTNVFEWNNVWGSGTTDYSGGLTNQTGRNGNLSADPVFRDPAHGDLGLASTSPCIDAGDGTYASEQDLAGLPRNDYPRAADTGVPMPGTTIVPDLGALEYSQHVNTHVDLVVTAVTGPAVAMAGDEVTITWQVANRGTDRASGWRRDRVGLSTAMGARGQSSLVCDDVAFTATIEPGQTVTFAATVRVPGGTPGVWNWTVTANADDDIAEGANRANNTGLSANALTLSLPMMVLNAPTALSGTLTTVGAAAWYAVTVPAGQDALVRVDAGTLDARLRLYAGIGFLPTVYDYDWVSPSSAADPRLALPAAAGAQTVYVLVVAEDLPSGPTTFTASAAELVFALDACDRRSGGNAGATTVRLTGAGFSAAMTVELRNGAGSAIPAASVSVLNSGEAFAVLPLAGVVPGVYDIVAATGGAEAILNGAFTVTVGTGWDFACRVTAPPLVRPGRPFPLLIEFENTGDADCPPIMVSVSNDGGFPVWRGRRLEATVLSLAAAAPSGPTPGYLRPGERWTVAAWSASNNVLCNYTISWRSAFCTEAVDWDAVEAALCPCSHPHWDELWPALQAAVGDTDGDYILAAGAAVAEARAYGVVLLENTDIFQWLLDRQTYLLESAKVTGRVRRQGTMEPVGRLNLSLVPRGGTGAHAGVTWHDGRFAFWDLPAGVYDVTLAGVYGGEGLSLEVPADGVLRDVLLELPAGGALAGSVTDAVDGTPVAAAEVEVRDPVSGLGAQVLTGADGRYHVSGLPPNTVIVRVMPQDHAPAEGEVSGITAGATLAWNVAVPPGAVISGAVAAPGGAAVAGAVVLASPADGSPGRSARSAADGTYEVRGLAAGTYRLTVLADGYGAGVLDGVGLAAGGSASADLVLSVAGTLSGRVADAATDSPIAGAEIAVSGSVSLEPQLSDAAGLFSVGSLPAGEVALMVSAEGYLPLTQTVTIGGKATLEVKLERPWAVEGRVLDGATPAAGLGVYLYHATGASVAATTAADGRFGFADLRGGDWTLIVSGPVGEILVKETFSLEPATKTVSKEYDVGRGLVTGRVLDASGAPLAGADLRMARGGAVLAETTSDATGVFAFQTVTGGSYDFSVAHRAFGFAQRAGVAVASGATTDLGDWSPAGVSLQVRVTDGTVALPGAAVEVVWLSGNGGESVLAQASATGTVLFGGLAAGSYRLSTAAPGYAYRNQVVIVAGEDVEVTVALGPEGVLAGTVTTGDGSPSPFAMLWVTDLTDQVTALILADTNAEYRLGGLPAHPLRVWVTDSANVPVTFDVTPVPGTTTTADAVLPAVGARLRGRTVDLLGQALPGVTVQARTATGAVLKSTLSGLDGTYDLGPLPDGDFVLHCNVPGTAAVTLAVAVAGDTDLGDVTMGGSKRWIDGGTSGAKGIWDWLHGQQPPRRYINDTPLWRSLHQAIWQAYLASGRNCPNAAAAYDQASRSARSIDTRYDAWCLTYAAMSGMTSSEMNTLAAEIGILTGKISLLVANFAGAMDTMTGPAYLSNISPNAPADLVKAYNDMGFAIDFAVDSLTRLVAYLRSGDMSASDAMFEQALSSVQFVVGAIEMFAKVAVQSGVAGSTATTLAGGAVGKALGVVMTLKDLYGYWKDLKEKERNILETIKANERAQEMYHDMVQRHIQNLAALSEAIACDDDDDPPPPPPPPPPPNPRPPPGGFPDGGNGPSAAVGRVISRDPNAKESLGVGAANWVPGDRAITYIVYFENEASATAPAQTVTISDVFDANLDIESFEALQVSFNGTTIAIPAGTRDFLGTATVASDPYPVRLRVTLNAATRTATWSLQSYDPATGELPTDPLAGFLPPNDDTGRGEGFVVFRLAPLTGLPTGTQIRNVARIVFDENEPIMTNQIDPHDPAQGTSAGKEALATLDIEAPASAVAGLDAVSPPGLVVSWAGRDDLAGVAGSGAATYTVYVQDNGGPFTPWLTDTPLTTETYNGQAGHTYGFYSIATDAVGWHEAAKAAAEATTVVAYTVRFEAGAHGGLTGSTTQYVAPGEQTSAVEAGAAEGYHFVAWMQDGEVYSREHALVVSDVHGDLTLTAEFEINQYTVAYLAENGRIVGAASQTVAHGSAGQPVTVEADPGYHFVEWSDHVLATTRSEHGVVANVAVTAICVINTYTVTFMPGAQGSLPGGAPTVTATAHHGDPAPATPAITPAEGWAFTGWSPLLPETITADLTTTAQYARVTHTVTFLPGAHGRLPGDVPSVTATVNHGDPAPAAPTVSASEGWAFTGWSPALPETTTADLTTTAQYVRVTRTVTFHSGAHGSLPGGVPTVTATVNHGDPAPAAPAVTPAEGWAFTGWSLALPETITADLTTTAQYVRVTRTVTFLPGAHGSLPGGVLTVTTTVNHGDSAPVAPTITPVAGWLFTGWSPALPDTITADLTTTAQYGPAGAVAPNGLFHAAVDAAAAVDGAGIWVLTGEYATVLGSRHLAMNLTHDSRGRVVGGGTFRPDPLGAPTYGIPLVLRGSVKGSAGATVVKLTLDGQRIGTPGDAQASARVTIRLTAALDVRRKALAGSALVVLSMGAEQQTTTPGFVFDLPAAADGTYALDFDLARAGTTLGCVTTLTFADGTAYLLQAKGRYSAPVSVLRLSGAPSDPAAAGIRLDGTILTLEDGSVTIRDLSGTAFGQTLNWHP